MDGDALPRLPARLGEPLVGSHPPLGDSSARHRVVKPRALLPRSAGASSPQRLRVRHTALVATGDAASLPPDTDAVVFVPSHRQAVVATRPSSVRASPRKSSRVSQAVVSDAPTSSFSSDAIDDQLQQAQWQAVQTENEQLRHEIVLLQQRLVEKMRGGSKVLVGGGQFRATGAPLPVPKQPPSSRVAAVSMCQPCGPCLALQTALNKLREGQEQTQQTLMLRTAQLEHAQDVLQTEIQERDDECSRLQDQLRVLGRQEAVASKQVQNQQMEIARLEAELSRVTAKTIRSDSPRVWRQVATAEVASQSELVVELRPESSIEKEHKREEETQTLRDVLLKNQEWEQVVETLRHEFHDSTQSHQLMVTRLQREISEQERCVHEAECHLLEAQETRDQLRQQVEMVKRQLDEVRRREELLNTELEQHRQHIARCEHDLVICRTETERTTQGYLDELTKLREKLLHTEADASRGNEERDLLVNKVSDGEKTIGMLTKALEAREGEGNEGKAREKHMQMQLEELQQAIYVTQHELQIFQTRHHELQLQCEIARARASAAEVETEALGDTVRRLKKAHTAEMKRAVQSLVRLCVVAPTVNVHLNTNNGSSVVACKAALPEKQLRQVVEEDVLPHFSTIFLQLKEGMSPDGGAMDPWVQGLLRDMQENLAVHLQKLYTATHASPAGGS